MHRGFRVNPAIVVAVAALVVACVGGAYAAGSASSGSITACVRAHGGALYVAGHCARHDRRLRWNVTGPQGLQGANGADGQPGTAGAAGTPGTPATKLFAQITYDGKVNTSSVPITVNHFATGNYYINFGVDVTHCVVVANQGGIPVYTSPGASTPAANGYGVRVTMESAGDTSTPGYPSATSVGISTFNGTASSDTSFYVAVLC